MLISKASIQLMLNQILSCEDFNEQGHYDENKSIELVKQLGKWIKEGPETLFIPEDAIPYIKNSVIHDIILGQNRPLDYLCSDCKYPKWCMTLEEVRNHQGYDEEYISKKIRKDGFVNISDACPKCGD